MGSNLGAGIAMNHDRMVGVADVLDNVGVAELVVRTAAVEKDQVLVEQRGGGVLEEDGGVGGAAVIIIVGNHGMNLSVGHGISRWRWSWSRRWRWCIGGSGWGIIVTLIACALWAIALDVSGTVALVADDFFGGLGKHSGSISRSGSGGG